MKDYIYRETYFIMITKKYEYGESLLKISNFSKNKFYQIIILRDVRKITTVVLISKNNQSIFAGKSAKLKHPEFFDTVSFLLLPNPLPQQKTHSYFQQLHFQGFNALISSKLRKIRRGALKIFRSFLPKTIMRPSNSVIPIITGIFMTSFKRCLGLSGNRTSGPDRSSIEGTNTNRTISFLDI